MKATMAPSELNASAELSEFELMSVVNFVLTSPTLEPKDKEKIIKQLFAGKPALLEKLLVNHPGFKALFEKKQLPEKTPTVAAPSTLPDLIPTPAPKPMNSTNVIKYELDWIKSPKENQSHLSERFKTCLVQDIPLTPSLVKSIIELPPLKSPLPAPVEKSQPQLQSQVPSQSIEEQSKQNERIFDALYKEVEQFKTQQQSLTAAIIEANQQVEILVREKEAAEEMMQMIITKIHEMIAGFNTIKPGQNSEGFELLKLLGKNREAAQIRFNELIQQNTANFSAEERQFFDREDVPLEVKVSLYNYIETANNNGINKTMRPNLAGALSTIYNNRELNDSQRQKMSLEQILLSMIELNQLLKEIKHLSATEANKTTLKGH